MEKTIRELTRSYTDKAILILIEIAENPKAPAASRVQACNALLDRAWGKPIQFNEIEGRLIREPSPQVSELNLEERIQLIREMQIENCEAFK